MAVRTFIKHPTAYTDSTSDWSNISNAYDGDIDNTYATKDTSIKGYENSYFKVSGFNFNLPEGTSVKTVRLYVKGSGTRTSGSGSTICCRFQSASTTKYQGEVGDGNISSLTYRSTLIGTTLGNAYGSALNGLNSCEFWLLAGARGSAASSEVRIYDMYISAECDVPEYFLTLNSGEGGSVSGAGTYAWGDTVSISATPKQGYKFTKWSDGNTEATRTITVTENTTLYAEFWKDLPPKILDVSLTYSGEQVSKNNKVPAGEGYLLAVGVGYSSSV